MKSVNNNLAATTHDILPQSSSDAVLLPYLQAESDEDSEQSLVKLIAEHVDPVVREVIGRNLHLAGMSRGGDNAAQAEDIRGDVVVYLLARLRKLKADPREEAITDLRGYVAVMATHACYRYLRRKHPQRHILKEKLRYLLLRQNGLALWKSDEGETVAGFAAWRAGKMEVAADRFEMLMRNPSACIPSELSVKGVGHTRPAALLAAIFDYAGGPLPLDALVNAVASLWGIEDHEESDEEVLARVADRRAGAGDELESREYLRRLWEEIKQLPLRQRVALLLNFKEEHGRGCIALLPLMGIAAMRQIAEALEMTAAQLAELWQLLPMDDARIAARLQLTRQQVINLRKSARERLTRRMREFG
jgi:RNA polymerase sigma factor (sigma-70 family)